MNVLGIPGMNGTVTFVGDNEETFSIDELFSNSQGNGLPTILAYAKNGSPLVSAKGDAGYEESVQLNPYLPTDPDAYRVDNLGGPLMMIKPFINLSTVVTNVKEIRVELIPDSYAHLNGADAKYQKNTVKFYGPGLEKERVFTVSELEGMQITAKTQDYSMLNKAGTATEARYRGVGVYDLFKLIGINNNAGDVTVECADGSSYTYSLMQLKKAYPNFLAAEKENVFAMLAYGEGNIGDDKMSGKPLTSETGGPLMLVVPQETADSVNKNLCLKNVKSVYVSANEITTWGHAMSDVFSEFLDYKFDVTFKNDKSEVSKTYTVAELEEMLDIIVRDTYTVLDIGECEGVDLWKLIKRTAGDSIDISNPVSVIAYAEDGYKNDLLANCGIGGFVDGIEGNNGMLKIILSYAVKGYPLVDKENHEGYTGLTKNCDGPLRIVVEAFQGGSIKYCNKVVVTLPGSDELVIK
ncbi:MAG: molybdopterin-dependent oxidoreductase [Clostridia bacterium]|nr:molybdopterin-dependent oxidoreductase [Clostridia bacterium]